MDRPPVEHGRAPEPAEQSFDTSRSVAETYDERGAVERFADGAHEILTDTKMFLGSAAVTAGNLVELQYDVVDVPGIQDYPGALETVAGLGAAVVLYNLADRAYDYAVPRTGEALTGAATMLPDIERREIDPLLQGLDGYDEVADVLEGQPLDAGVSVESGAGSEEPEFYGSKDGLGDESWVRDGWLREDR